MIHVFDYTQYEAKGEKTIVCAKRLVLGDVSNKVLHTGDTESLDRCG